MTTICIITAITTLLWYQQYQNTFAQTYQADTCVDLDPLLAQKIHTTTSTLLQHTKRLTSKQSIMQLAKYADKFNKLSVKATIQNKTSTALISQCIAKNMIVAIGVHKSNIKTSSHKPIAIRLDNTHSAPVVHPIIDRMRSKSHDLTLQTDQHISANKMQQHMDHTQFGQNDNATDIQVKPTQGDLIQANNDQMSDFAYTMGITVSFDPQYDAPQ